MIDLADKMLLAEARNALSVPFRDPVRVGGVLIPRRFARAIERSLGRLAVLDRRQRVAAAPVSRCSPFTG